VNPGLGSGSNRAETPPAAARDETPDFGGLPLKRYLVPDLVLPLMTAHGCYHGQCGFATWLWRAIIWRGQGVSPAAVEQVLEQIATVQKKHGTRHIFFADEAIPPRTLRLLSAGLAEQGAPSTGAAAPGSKSRLHRSYWTAWRAAVAECCCSDSRPLRADHRAHGQRHAARDDEPRLERRCRAGIWNHTFFSSAFPARRWRTRKTLSTLCTHTRTRSIRPRQAVCVRTLLAGLSPPEKFGVRRIVQKPDRDLAIHFDYEVESAWTPTWQRLLSNACWTSCPPNGSANTMPMTCIAFARHSLHAQASRFHVAG